MTRLLPLLLLVAALPAAAQPFRDANCNGQVDDADRAAVVRRLFAASPATTCTAVDVNRDGQPDAADLVAFARGPTVSFIGIASPDGQPAPSLGTLEDGTPVYFRNAGFGFLIVVEGATPPSGAPIGLTVVDSVEGDPSRRPDFQIVADHALGNGSRDICDEFGVPADAALDFSQLTQALANTINDLSCRFDAATRANTACTQNSFGQLGFVATNTRAQFCLSVTSGMVFPAGDTEIAVQLRDESGLVGPVRKMMLRIENGPFPPTFTPLPPTATPTPTDTQSPTPSPSVTRTASNTPTQTLTRTPTNTGTRTRTATVTRTAPPSPTTTRTPTISPTPTATSNARGPEITFFGLTRADDMLVQPDAVENGIPVYKPSFGFAFSIVIEAKPGPSRARVGNSTFVDGDAPDFQVQVTRPLGDGSSLVCDDMPPMLGGVPAINPPSFDLSPSNIDRINDLACRFIDGAGNKVGRQCDVNTACVLGEDGLFGCASADATIQFCGFIGQALTFPSGDTTVTVRVRDVQGNFGAPRQLLIRVP